VNGKDYILHGGDIFLTKRIYLKRRIKLLKIFAITVEWKHVMEKITHLLNANVENSFFFFLKNGIIEENSPLHAL
jgi:hypothetical protein